MIRFFWNLDLHYSIRLFKYKSDAFKSSAEKNQHYSENKYSYSLSSFTWNFLPSNKKYGQEATNCGVLIELLLLCGAISQIDYDVSLWVGQIIILITASRVIISGSKICRKNDMLPKSWCFEEKLVKDIKVEQERGEGRKKLSIKLLCLSNQKLGWQTILGRIFFILVCIDEEDLKEWQVLLYNYPVFHVSKKKNQNLLEDNRTREH